MEQAPGSVPGACSMGTSKDWIPVERCIRVSQHSVLDRILLTPERLARRNVPEVDVQAEACFFCVSEALHLDLSRPLASQPGAWYNCKAFHAFQGRFGRRGASNISPP